MIFPVRNNFSDDMCTLFLYVYVIITVSLSCYVRPPTAGDRWSSSMRLVLLEFFFFSSTKFFPLHYRFMLVQDERLHQSEESLQSVGFLSIVVYLNELVSHETQIMNLNELGYELKWTRLYINYDEMH